jgi:hypothetical protein
MIPIEDHRYGAQTLKRELIALARRGCTGGCPNSHRLRARDYTGSEKEIPPFDFNNLLRRKTDNARRIATSHGDLDLLFHHPPQHHNALVRSCKMLLRMQGNWRQSGVDASVVSSPGFR